MHIQIIIKKKCKPNNLLIKQTTQHYISKSHLLNNMGYICIIRGGTQITDLYYCGFLAATVCFLLMVNYPMHGQKLPQYLLFLHLNQTFEYLLTDIL